MKTRILSFAVLVVGVCFFLSPRSAEAQEIFEFYTGVRQLGMGGAYTAVVNDETAVLTNPAGLGKIRDVTFTLVDPELHGSFENTRAITLSNASKVFAIQDLLDTLNNSKGTHWHAKAQIFPSIIAPNFGFGLLGNFSYDAEVDPTGTTFRLDYRNDLALAVGYSFRFFGGIVKLGVAARLVDRIEISKDIPANSTGVSVDSLGSEGMGLGTDIGLTIAAPVALIPTISAVVRDVGMTTYEMSDGLFRSTTTRPQPTPQTVDAGFALFPILANHMRATITAEVHGLTTLGEETDFMRRLHTGLELNFSDFLFLRGGMNQRYWTAGIELASERFQLQAATYGEEIGIRPATREDRRWVGKFAFRF